jgi:hypothetical protein
MGETCGAYGREHSSIYGFGGVGTASRYGLDGPVIESRWGDIFHPRPDRVCVPSGLLYNGYRVYFQGRGGGQIGRRMALITLPHLLC